MNWDVCLTVPISNTSYSIFEILLLWGLFIGINCLHFSPPYPGFVMFDFGRFLSLAAWHIWLYPPLQTRVQSGLDDFLVPAPLVLYLSLSEIVHGEWPHGQEPQIYSCGEKISFLCASSCLIVLHLPWPSVLHQSSPLSPTTEGFSNPLNHWFTQFSILF